jgi:pyruvate carboxylase
MRPQDSCNRGIDGEPRLTLPRSFALVLCPSTQNTWGKTGRPITSRDVMSAALYPKVFDEYREHIAKFGELTTKLSSTAFFHEMEEDDEVEVEVSPGQAVVIKFKVRYPLQ